MQGEVLNYDIVEILEDSSAIYNRQVDDLTWFLT